MVNVGIIGDYNPQYKPHVATIDSLHHAARWLSIPINVQWIPTDSIEQGANRLRVFDALWCAPGSPYRSFEGALWGIRFARESDLPFLGTCGGFQHVVIEYARNVLGFQDAEHAEHDPYGSKLFVARLACSLVGQRATVRLEPGSRAYGIYQKSAVAEEFLCNFGLNPVYKELIHNGGLRVVGADEQGEARVLELPNNRFFIATLFVPQLTSSTYDPHPLIVSYLKTASIFRRSRLNKADIKSRT